MNNAFDAIGLSRLQNVYASLQHLANNNHSLTILGLDISFSKVGLAVLHVKGGENQKIQARSASSNVILNTSQASSNNASTITISTAMPVTLNKNNLRGKTTYYGALIPPRGCNGLIERSMFFESKVNEVLDMMPKVRNLNSQESILTPQSAIVDDEIKDACKKSKWIISIEENLQNYSGRGKGMMVVSQVNAILRYQLSKRYGIENVFMSMPRSARRGLGIPSGLETNDLKETIKDMMAKFDTSIEWNSHKTDYDIADALMLSLHGIREHQISEILKDKELLDSYDKLYKTYIQKESDIKYDSKGKIKKKTKKEEREYLEQREEYVMQRMRPLVDAHFNKVLLPNLFR